MIVGMKRMFWIAVICAPLAMMAQTGVPAGTIMAVSLDKSLKAEKARAGQTFQATVMQTVPGTEVHRGAKIVGQVVQVSTDPSGVTQLALRFDTIKTHGRMMPVRTSLRALASFLEVEEAQVPEDMAIRGITPETATTQQVGGEQVYRGGGPVASGDTVVGKPVPYGVLVTPRAQVGKSCRGSLDGNNQPQALWLFSSDACGVYGYSDLRIERAGRSNPSGNIVLVTKKHRLLLRSGTGLLLRVQGS